MLTEGFPTRNELQKVGIASRCCKYVVKFESFYKTRPSKRPDHGTFQVSSWKGEDISDSDARREDGSESSK